MTLTPTPWYVRLVRRVLYCQWGHYWIRERLASGAPAWVCLRCRSLIVLEVWPWPINRLL